MTEGKMGVREFGDRLITTRDLDPVYVGVVGAKLPEPQLCRWLLAYWCFYHVGAASWLSELADPIDYWSYMHLAAENDLKPRSVRGGTGPAFDRWPRASERRHFRGQKCVNSVLWLKTVFLEPEGAVKSLSSRVTDKAVMEAVCNWPMFGPWIAFKAADMMERVYGARVEFDRNLGLMYEEPRRGLDMWVAQEKEDPSYNPNDPIDAKTVYGWALTYFNKHPAPPIREEDGTLRRCGPQEVETVLCKWKSYLGGHYHVGKDIYEQRAALVGWGATAERILAAYPEEVSP